MCDKYAVAVHHFARFRAEADFIKMELTPVQTTTAVDQNDPDSLYYGRMVPMPKTESQDRKSTRLNSSH